MCDFKSKVIYDKDNDFGDVMIMALRYALGRRTYVTNEICDFIKQNKLHIDERVKEIMTRDIKKYLEDRKNGVIKDDECDKEAFVRLLEEIGNSVG